MIGKRAVFAVATVCLATTLTPPVWAEPFRPIDHFGTDRAHFNRAAIEAGIRFRDSLLRYKREFEGKFMGLDTPFHALVTSRLMWNPVRAKQEGSPVQGDWGGHILLQGDAGAAKTSFANFAMDRETRTAPHFKLLMHEWIAGRHLVGGEKEAALKAGKIDIETSGTLIEAKVALIEEMEKSNPAVFALMHGLLNEGEFYLQGALRAKLETVFATTNASLDDLARLALAANVDPAAFLNRFLFKMRGTGWLAREQQAQLDDLRKSDQWNPMAMAYPKHFESRAADPLTINWDDARLLSYAMFRPSQSYSDAALSFFRSLKSAQQERMDTTEDACLERNPDTRIPYIPTGYLTERLRYQLDFVVRASAAADFFLSPLAADMERALDRFPYAMLGPESLWRAAHAMTALGTGHIRPTVEVKKKRQTMGIDFGETPVPVGNKDKRQGMEYERLEREDFQRAWKDVVLAQTEIMAELARFAPDGEPLRDDSNYEAYLLKENGR